MRAAGVIAAAVLAAAVLGLGSLLAMLAVVAGQENTQPGTPGVICAPPGVDPASIVKGFGPEQISNAGLIIAAGVEMKVPPRGIAIAVATSMQEAKLQIYANSTVPESMAIPHQAVGSDHDSVGLFQQREAGWGDLATRMDPKASARLFYDRLLKVPGWEALPFTQAAQAVQVSAIPDAYAKWEQPASTIVGAMQGVSCSAPTAPGGGVRAPDPRIQRVIDRGMSQMGKPYVWAGGDANGPTGGGFDCSGLMVYAFSELGVSVPHQTQQIWSSFQPPITDRNALQPGDMVLFSSNGQPTGIHHVGLYLGAGRMLHAPESGDVVKVADNMWASPTWNKEFIGGVRAVGPAQQQPPPPAG